MTEAGYNFSDLIREAQGRWLKPAEVLFILQNHENHQIAHEPPQKPGSGSLFLFNKRVLRFFRKDGHSWRRKRDGRTVGEAHERLKVGSAEALNCYYAHGEQNPNFQRRSYWMLDPAYEHIVLVHYRDISEVTPKFGGFDHIQRFDQVNRLNMVFGNQWFGAAFLLQTAEIPNTAFSNIWGLAFWGKRTLYPKRP